LAASANIASFSEVSMPVSKHEYLFVFIW
jgi:hypothetical protein